MQTHRGIFIPIFRRMKKLPKSKTYEEFVEKFKPKKTTDDCYTPPSVYAVIRDWACSEYGIDPAKIVRPFYPGNDYERFDYPPGAVVLDNPPFSIISKICEFYLDRGIPFFLFAPSLTCLSGRAIWNRMNHIICGCDIVYENGAIVRTSFVTSYGGDIVVQTEPRLTKLVNDEVKRLQQQKTVQLPKYAYPDHVITAAMMQRYSQSGIDLEIRRNECQFIPALDAQRSMGKAIFGGGLLLSDRVAAERVVAERVAAERAAERVAERAAERAAIEWQLSDRERDIVAMLSSEPSGN